jgi:hypothetical protein
VTAIPGLGIRAASRPRPLAGSPPDGGPGLERTVNPLATVLTRILTTRLAELTQGRIARGRPFTCAHVSPMDLAIWSPTLRDGLLLCIGCYCEHAEQAFGGPEEHCGICGVLYRGTAGRTLMFRIPGQNVTLTMHPELVRQSVTRPPIVVFAGICPACLAKYRTQGVRHGDA